MKKLLVAGLIFACASIGVVRAQPMQGDDHAQLVALENQFAAAFRAKDLNAIMKVYAPGSTFVFDLLKPREHPSYASYRKDWQTLFSQYKGSIQLDLSELSIVTDGKLGYGHSIQHMVATKPNGKKDDLTARVTDDYRKIDGKWYVVQEHVSVPLDPVTLKPDMDSKP
jgi:ketosteroid isomerase-like protein